MNITTYQSQIDIIQNMQVIQSKFRQRSLSRKSLFYETQQIKGNALLVHTGTTLTNHSLIHPEIYNFNSSPLQVLCLSKHHNKEIIVPIWALAHTYIMSGHCSHIQLNQGSLVYQVQSAILTEFVHDFLYCRKIL